MSMPLTSVERPVAGTVLKFALVRATVDHSCDDRVAAREQLVDRDAEVDEVNAPRDSPSANSSARVVSPFSRNVGA
jgi:hypothetical protein